MVKKKKTPNKTKQKFSLKNERSHEKSVLGQVVLLWFVNPYFFTFNTDSHCTNQVT